VTKLETLTEIMGWCSRRRGGGQPQLYAAVEVLLWSKIAPAASWRLTGTRAGAHRRT
jgi:hypothetical protein